MSIHTVCVGCGADILSSDGSFRCTACGGTAPFLAIIVPTEADRPETPILSTAAANSPNLWLLMAVLLVLAYLFGYVSCLAVQETPRRAEPGRLHIKPAGGP